MINNCCLQFSGVSPNFFVRKDRKVQKTQNFLSREALAKATRAVKIQTEVCEGSKKKKARKVKHAKSSKGHKATKVFKKHKKTHAKSKQKHAHKNKKAAHKKQVQHSKHASKHHAKKKQPVKIPAPHPVSPAPVKQTQLPLEDSMQAVRAHYRELIPFFSPQERVSLEENITSNASIDTIRTQCSRSLCQTIATRIQNFQGSHEPLYPVVKRAFPNYPDLLAFVLEGDTLVQTASMLLQMPLGQKALDYVTQTMQDFRTRQYTIDQLIETSTRFGKLLFLYEHHNAQLALLQWDNPRASSQAIDRATEAVFRMQLPSFERQQRLENASKAIALNKINQFALFVSKALVRPNGEINQAIVPALKEKLQQCKKSLGSFAYVHMANVLFQIARDEQVVVALRHTQPPCAVFQSAVRQAAHMRTEGTVDRIESMVAIVSALLTPWHQPDNFGSCQTTAPLAVIRNASLEIAIQDMQEIIRNGKIIRTVLGRETSYIAMPQSYPMQRECSLSSRHPETNLVHPLLSAWENCLAGTQTGMQDSDYVNNIGIGVGKLWGSSCYRTMQAIAKALRIKNSPFSSKVSPSDPRLNPLKQLRFSFTPPHKTTDTCWNAQLCFENERHEWEQITDKNTLQKKLAYIFEKITHKKLPPTGAKVLRQSFERTFGSSCLHFSTTPLTFYQRSDSGMGDIYFSRNSRLKNIDFSNVRDAAEQFRQIAIEQKNVYRNVKNMSFLAQGAFTGVATQHVFQLKVHSKFLTDQEKTGKQWIADKEQVLRSTMAAQELPLIDGLVGTLTQSYFANSSQRQPFIDYMRSKSTLSLCDWCKELVIALKRFASVPDSELESLNLTILNHMNVYSPSLYGQLVFPFANTNYALVGEREQVVTPTYYCFACIPSLTGAPTWRVLEISKRKSESKNRRVMDVGLQNMQVVLPDGKAFDRYKTREHSLRQERHGLALERHLKAYCAAWVDVAREQPSNNATPSRARRRLQRAHRKYHEQLEEGHKMNLCSAPEMVLAREGTYPREALEALLM